MFGGLDGKTLPPVWWVLRERFAKYVSGVARTLRRHRDCERGDRDSTSLWPRQCQPPGWPRAPPGRPPVRHIAAGARYVWASADAREAGVEPCHARLQRSHDMCHAQAARVMGMYACEVAAGNLTRRLKQAPHHQRIGISNGVARLTRSASASSKSCGVGSFEPVVKVWNA